MDVSYLTKPLLSFSTSSIDNNALDILGHKTSCSSKIISLGLIPRKAFGLNLRVSSELRIQIRGTAMLHSITVVIMQKDILRIF